MTVKELKTNNMGYTPYKMVGHELKGIKQRKPAVAKMKSFGVDQKDGPDGVSQKSGILYAQGGVGSSPNKFLGISPIVGGIKGMMEKVKAKKLEKQQGAFQAGGGSDLESRVSALEAGGGGSTPSSGTDPVMASLGMGGGGAQPMAADKMKKKSLAEGWGGSAGSQQAAKNAVTMMSDIRLKEKIEKAGKSPSGIPIYVFSYIGDNRRYEGAMAQDLISMGIDAVETQESGYYSVDYSKIDVDMKLIN